MKSTTCCCGPPQSWMNAAERVHGVRTQPLTGTCRRSRRPDLVHARVARLAPDTSGSPRRSHRTAHLPLPVSPPSQRQAPGAGSIRMAAALLQSDAYKDVAEYRIQPTDDVLARTTLWTSISGRLSEPPDTSPGRARWVPITDRWRSLTNTAT